MTLLQIIGMAEAFIILVLVEPSLNRMTPCAPMMVRIAFHAIAIGSAIRLYHLLAGHDPSWSSVVQVGGLAALLIVERLRRKNKADRRRRERRYDRRLTDSLRGPPTVPG